MFRAVLGRPTLSGAAALAVASAAAAGVSAASGHHPLALASGPSTSAAAALVTGDVPATGPGSVAAADRSADVSGTTTTGALAEGERAALPAGEFGQRRAADRAKARRLAAERASRAAHRRALLNRNPKVVARAMLERYGWGASQFSCLDSLWTRESKWSLTATNPTSGAYGIPQALPGTKMATVGSDWRTNPLTQITWGLGYIRARYGSPCGAWGHSQASGWY